MAPAALRGDVPRIETVQAPPVWITSGRLDWVLIRVSIQHGTALHPQLHQRHQHWLFAACLDGTWCTPYTRLSNCRDRPAPVLQFQYVHSS